MTQHIHLDLVGGLSGDMFIGGMLDAFPALAEQLDALMVAAGFPDLVALELQPHDDGTLTGSHFDVSETTVHEDHHHHHHRHHSDIRDKLKASALPEQTRDGALAMFQMLAEAEGQIHGKHPDDVAFHEVGAWDSIADIVIAAHLIAEVDATWSVSAIPAGSGFVETAHGRLPVPAPATALLLRGFELLDDGIKGERVTPTGAVILKFLDPDRRLPTGATMQQSGYGFGTKTFPGLSNVVRVNVFGVDTAAGWDQDQIVRLSFELDDQTPESVSQALDQIRGETGVLDVTQQVCWGKKNRQGTSVAVLARPAAEEDVTRCCFAVTTTLGIRREVLQRSVLKREEVIVHVGERPYRVKVAHRPGGLTAKIEMDDLAASDLTPAEQKQVRVAAESLALEQLK